MAAANSDFSGKEKRRNERLKCSEPVSIRYQESEYHGVIKDKSEKGFYIEIDQDLFQGLKIDLEYYSATAQKELHFTARVVRKNSSGIGLEIRYES